MKAIKETNLRKAVEDFNETGTFPDDQTLLDDIIYHYGMVIEYSYVIPEFGLVRGELLRQLNRFKDIKHARDSKNK